MAKDVCVNEKDYKNVALCWGGDNVVYYTFSPSLKDLLLLILFWKKKSEKIAKIRDREGSPKMRGMVVRRMERASAMKTWSNARKSICLPSHAQAAANDLENVSEGGACYKPQTNWSISFQSMQ